MSHRRGGPPRRVSRQSKDEIDGVGAIIRNQLNILRTLNKEEEETLAILDEIKSKMEEIERVMMSPTPRMVIGLGFMIDCSTLVVHASPKSMTGLFRLQRAIMRQMAVKKPDPYVSMMMQVEYVFGFSVCLVEHVKYIKMQKMKVALSVADSMTSVTDLVDKYVAPFIAGDEDHYKQKAIEGRRNFLLGPKKEGGDNDEIDEDDP